MSSRRLKRDIPAFRGQESVRLDESKLDLWSVIGWPRSPHRSTAKKLGPQNFDFSRNFLQITHSKLSPLPSLIRRAPPVFLFDIHISASLPTLRHADNKISSLFYNFVPFVVHQSPSFPPDHFNRVANFVPILFSCFFRYIVRVLA